MYHNYMVGLCHLLVKALVLTRIAKAREIATVVWF